MQKLTRRATLIGAAAASSSALVPFVGPAFAEQEEPWATVRRLAQELSDALNYVDQKNWRVWIEASDVRQRPVLFEDQTATGPRDRLDHYGTLFARAIRDFDPSVKSVGTLWNPATGEFSGLAVRRARKA